MASIRCLGCRLPIDPRPATAKRPASPGCACTASRWEVRGYAGVDPVTKKERTRSATVHGGRRRARDAGRDMDAQRKADRLRRRGATTKATLGKLLEDFMAGLDALVESGERSPTTVRGYRGYIDNHIKPALGDVPLDQLDVKALDDFYSALRTKRRSNGKPFSPRAGEQCHAIVSAALSAAVDWRWVPENVAVRAHPPRPGRRKKGWVQADAVVFLLNAAWARSRLLTTMSTLSGTTGKRRGEVVAPRRSVLERFTEETELGPVVRWRMDFCRVVVVVKGGLVERQRTKTDAVNTTVRLHPFAAALVEMVVAEQDERARAVGVRLDPDPFIFSEAADGSTPVHPDSLTGFWTRLNDDAEKAVAVVNALLAMVGSPTEAPPWRRITLKALRDLVASMGARGGIDMKTMQGQLTHSQISTTADIYAQFDDSASQDVADLMGRELFANRRALEAAVSV